MIRKSDAALAWIIRANELAENECLLQWNSGWNAYSLVGGHVEPGETFRQACAREIEEELLCVSNDYELAAGAYATLRFREFSKAARVETDYNWQVFLAWPSTDLLARLPDNCAWADSTHIRAGQTASGLPIADQVQRVLAAVVRPIS